MAAPNKLTARQVKEIREHYTSGEAEVTIAAWYDVSPSTVRHHTQDIRGKGQRNGQAKIDRAKLAQMLNDGMTKARIARHFGVTENGVYHAISRMKSAGVAA